MHMLFNQNKSCVKSCQKHCFLKNNNIVFQKTPLFSKKNHSFPTCALFYPIVLKRKIITGLQFTFFKHLPTITPNFSIPDFDIRLIITSATIPMLKEEVQGLTKTLVTMLKTEIHRQKTVFMYQ